MGKYGIGARVRDEDGDEGVIVGKRRGERLVFYGSDLGYITLWNPKCELTPLPAKNDDTPAPAEQVQGGSPVEWQPKVGDRVRFTEPYGGAPAGTSGEVTHSNHAEDASDGYLVGVAGDDGDSYGIFSRRLEPLPVAAEAQGAPEEKWVPEVGQRVRCIDNGGARRDFTVGEVYTVRERKEPIGTSDDWLIRVEENDSAMFVYRFEPAPLTIEAGKFYKTRDGRKVGPMRDDWRHSKEYRFHATESELPGHLWAKDGTNYKGFDKAADIVAEWTTDEPNTPRKIKAGDKLVCVKGYVDTVKEGEIYTAIVDEHTQFGGTFVDVAEQRGLSVKRFRHATAEDLGPRRFKVGDRVRVKDSDIVGTVETRSNAGTMAIKHDSGIIGLAWWHDDELELATIAAGSLVTLAAPLVVNHIDGDDAYFDHGALPLSALVLA